MCNDMIDLKNAKGRIIELEGELKSTRKDYMDEIVALARHNGVLKQEIEELKRKLAFTEEDEYVACPDNYIIIDDTDSDPSEPDFEDEAGADIMESSTGSNFQMTTKQQQYFPPCNHYSTCTFAIVRPLYALVLIDWSDIVCFCLMCIWVVLSHQTSFYS